MTNWKHAGHTAVITGGANGIGYAFAERYAEAGMNVVIADRDAEALKVAKAGLDEIGDGGVLAQTCDVTDKAQVDALCSAAFDTFGAVHCLMNNAGAAMPAGKPWEDLEAVEKTLQVNLMGIIYGCHAFVPKMLEAGTPGVVVNTGSKQGITKPPGNYAYNLSKAGVLAYSESLAQAFATTEGCELSAHLLVPGFVYSSMISKFLPEQPPGAWTPEETVDFALPCIESGDFYVLCPDNDVTRKVDEKRIQWNTDDIIKNRPALSRWHPDFAAEFEEYMK